MFLFYVWWHWSRLEPYRPHCIVSHEGSSRDIRDGLRPINPSECVAFVMRHIRKWARDRKNSLVTPDDALLPGTLILMRLVIKINDALLTRYYSSKWSIHSPWISWESDKRANVKSRTSKRHCACLLWSWRSSRVTYIRTSLGFLRIAADSRIGYWRTAENGNLIAMGFHPINWRNVKICFRFRHFHLLWYSVARCL